jgi:type IV pilus assembly protein PilY1
MKIDTKRSIDRAVAAVALFCTIVQPTYALTLASEPLFLANRVPPKVMIALSKDQQLYKKAYNDYSDLDGDAVPETTYKHSVTYYGYFDPIKCYKYVNNRFEPGGITTYTVTDDNGVTKPGSAYCNDQKDTAARWSGNFLNWVTMSRIDAVRKLLYGGMRSTDTATETVLERAFIPTDAHSWAKYYEGADITKLTPLTPTFSWTRQDVDTSRTVTIENETQDLAISFDDTITGISLGDQVVMQVRNEPTQYMYGAVIAVGSRSLTLRLNIAGISGAGARSSRWTLINHSSTGVSFCNLTQAEGKITSQNVKNPPLLRVAKGNFALWTANERWQCEWDRESSLIGVTNGNQASMSGIAASSRQPIQATHGMGTGTAVTTRDGTTVGATGQYIVRVKACASAALQGTENCGKYGANLKPVGLLQTYAGTIDFGLMTGSYEKNTSGGVLRKAVGSFSDEVNSDGTFKKVSNQLVDGIVKTLNSMRIYGYNYDDGTYLGAAGDNCNFQLTDIPPNACTSWGNPMSEIYYETLRYFASKTDNNASSAYTYTNNGSRDDKLGLPLQTWKAPMNQDNACAKINVLAFNASVSSDDEDLANTVMSGINSNKTARELTNTVGDLEGITNGSFFVGKRVGDTLATPGFELCTQKTISALGDVSGICPEGPTVRGSFLLAGLANYAHTNVLRTDLNVKNDNTALKVASYGIQLATNTPQLEIPVPGKPGQKVVIQPIYRYVSGSAFGGGSLVDMKIVSMINGPTSGSGKVYLNWEDSEQGGDYDQDMWGTLQWSINGNNITVITNAISQSTSNPQGFGYSISGTTADGPHFHSGINGFNYTDTLFARYLDPDNPNVTLSVKGCSNCQPADASSGQRGPSWITYALSSTGSTAGTLRDPLWYLSKYGGFDDRNQNGKLDAGEWDVQNNLTGEGTPDGIPDTYFLVTNPLGLESALERAFRNIAQGGSGSAVASNSGSIKNGSAVYSAAFRTGEWSGVLSAFTLASDGSIASTDWEASKKLPTPDKRVILTYRNDAAQRKGVPFRWPVNPGSLGSTDIGQDLVDALNTKPDGTGTNDGRGSERLAYLRGDASQEGNALNSFRSRTNKLGDIVNSTPVFVPSIPNDVILDSTYVDFQAPFLKSPRTPMVYVAANDGMLHGFDATLSNGAGGVQPGGTERIAYVPSKTFSGLNQLTNPNYVHRYFVDGTPTVADAKVDGQWKTVLVGALGRGGRGIYALDVTNPPDAASAAGNSSAIESSSAAKVLWEFNVDDDVPSNAAKSGGAEPYGLGYVLGQPLIRKMANGRWAAIVSGGYNSDETVPGKGAGSGKGYIYIIFLDGPKQNNGRTWEWGVDYIRLDTDKPANTGPNSMAPPFAADVNSDGMVDYIYAGDLLGNFWKFDVTDVKESQWNSPQNRVVLFAAGASQPITAAATGTLHPTGAGFLLTFGTGKYLEPTDPLPPFTTQAFYGIWDKNDKPNNISKQSVVTDKSSLLKQEIKTDNVTNNGVSTSFRYITNSAGVKGPDWKTQMGWYMDLPAAGERSVFEPLIVSRRLIFSTLVPSGGACDFGGTSYIMVVNPATGGEFDTPVLDVNRDGVLTVADTVPSTTHFAAGVESSVGITVTPKMLLGGVPKGQTSGSDTTLLFGDQTGRVSGAGNRRAALFVCGAAGQCATPELLGAGRDSGRASWREVLTK